MSDPRRAARAALLLFLAFAYSTTVTGSDAQPHLETLPQERVVLETRASGRHDFRVWKSDLYHFAQLIFREPEAERPDAAN